MARPPPATRRMAQRLMQSKTTMHAATPQATGATPAPAPLVSVLIPVRNERAFIANCLDSVLANDYPPERLEILVIDGASHDGTRAIVDAYASRVRAIRVLDNPKRITPAALNCGLRAARGELIVRLDAHARLAPDYLSQCAAWSAASGADNVGGRMRTLPRAAGAFAAAVALALSHPFGVGDSAFRTGRGAAGEPRWADTVFGGCYRREVFERIGEFNERLPRGQDMEFNQRLQRAGGRTLLVPAIRCDYFARCDPRSFLLHNWTNGVWAIRPFAESDVIPVRPRHLVPLVFVVALAAATVLCGLSLPGGWLEALSPSPAARALQALGPWPLVLLAACYLAAALAASAQLAWRSRDPRPAFVLPAVFLSLHLAYGLGSLWGLFPAAAAIVHRAVAHRQHAAARLQHAGLARPRQPKLKTKPTQTQKPKPMKRAIDLTLALFALTLLTPLLLLIAGRIRRESPGPVLYRGRRAGRGGSAFRIYKFRTMVDGADRLGGPTTAGDDARLTPLGKLLRRYKLDELPQLLNVVRGQMSLVGPRPEVIEKVARYSRQEKRILNARPGITDWASIWNADEGAALAGLADADRAYEQIIRPTKIHLQLLYCEHASLWVDAKILFYTLIKLCKKDWLPPELDAYQAPNAAHWARARS
jgi:lipopolysaccharide/colanic/teichoic acid biosynthesis glycosyltransferase/glycosyltransferase involved in cell wall biosynthesis